MAIMIQTGRLKDKTRSSELLQRPELFDPSKLESILKSHDLLVTFEKNQDMDEWITKEEALRRSLNSKEKLRSDLIKLPFEEKIRRVIEMQKMERELKKDKNKHIYVWTME